MHISGGYGPSPSHGHSGGGEPVLAQTAPTATTGAATGVGTSSATLNDTVNANGSSTTVTFEYGLTTGYGTTVTADQSPVTGNTNTAISATVSGLMPNTTYHYRVAAQNTNGTSYGIDMTFTTAEIIPIEVTIDIKPGSDPNSINPFSKGRIPVAILADSGFDVTSVNATTVRFGQTGIEAGAVHYSLEDVDNDGDIDMIFHFRTQGTGIAPGDTEATLTGQTTDGIEITGTDSVRIVPPEGKGKANKGSKPRKGGGQDNGNGNPNPGQGNNQGGGNDNPNSGQSNNQGGENGDSNPGQGKGKGKGK